MAPDGDAGRSFDEIIQRSKFTSFSAPILVYADMNIQDARGTAKRNLQIRFWVAAGAQMYRTSVKVARLAESWAPLPIEQALPK